MGFNAGSMDSNFFHYRPKTMLVCNVVYNSGGTVRFQQTVAASYCTLFVFALPLGFMVTGMGVRDTVFESVGFFLRVDDFFRIITITIVIERSYRSHLHSYHIFQHILPGIPNKVILLHIRVPTQNRMFQLLLMRRK